MAPSTGAAPRGVGTASLLANSLPADKVPGCYRKCYDLSPMPCCCSVLWGSVHSSEATYAAIQISQKTRSIDTDTSPKLSGVSNHIPELPFTQARPRSLWPVAFKNCLHEASFNMGNTHAHGGHRASTAGAGAQEYHPRKQQRMGSVCEQSRIVMESSLTIVPSLRSFCIGSHGQPDPYILISTPSPPGSEFVSKVVGGRYLSIPFPSNHAVLPAAAFRIRKCRKVQSFT